MSRAAALLEREVELQQFYGYAPLKAPRSNTRNTLRVLGNDEQNVMFRSAEELFTAPPAPSIPSIDAVWTEQATPLLRSTTGYTQNYQVSPYVAAAPQTYYHDSWAVPAPIQESSPSAHKFKIQNRLRLPGKRLPLFVILSLMAVGLVVAITPVFVRGSSPSSVRRSLSGYVSGGSLPQTDSQGDVPVIDVTSNPPASQPESNPKSEIRNPKSGDIVGSPSISVAGIESVLEKYGSPAVGKGQALYDLGVKYGINPAYALAFFVHESGCGTKGVARFTKSLGNIRTTDGYADYQGYRSYPTWEAGMEDWYKLIGDLYVGQWGLKTLDAIIPVYAPWGDNNNPPTYIASVKGMVESWRGK